MKKIVLFLSFLIAIKGFTQTYVSGNIKGNTIWTKANSPYILTGAVGVPAAYTLTIEPGVTVEKTAVGQGIIINGALQCNGTEADSVIFITNAPPNSGDNYFLKFQKANLSNSGLRFISFHNGDANALDIAVGDENIYDQTTPKNIGTLLVSRSTFNQGYSKAGGFNEAEAFHLDSCNIYASAIVLYGNADNITIYNSTITNATIKKNASWDWLFKVVNCNIRNSWLQSVSVDSSTVSGGKLFCPQYNAITKIHNSSFKNVPVDVVATNLEVINSKFSVDSNANLSDYPSYGSTRYLVGCAAASIVSSEFTAMDNMSCIFFTNPAFYPIQDSIVHNSFYNCSNALTVLDFNNKGIHIDSNNFYTVSRYAIENLSSKDFSAINNYYQLDPGQIIDDKIFDNNDDLSYGLVTYTSAVVLPLNLVNFAGQYINGQVILKWQTANEVNASKFIVQRLINGTYEDAGTVMAKGNTSNNYTFTPGSFNYGSNIYRLKMVDVDGQYKYSNSLSIDVSSLPLKIKVYPNPATNYIVISHTEAGSNSSLQLVDMSGKVIKTVPVTKGDIQNKLNIADVAAGMYKIIWHNGNTIQSQTVMVK